MAVTERPPSRNGTFQQPDHLPHPAHGARPATVIESVWVGWTTDLPFLLSLSITLLALTSLPYIWAYLTSPADQQFMGLTHTTHDYSQYMSWARESQTRVFVQNKLTSEQTAATFFNPVWWLVGRAELLFGASFAQVNQAFRALAIFVFVLTLGGFAAALLPSRERAFAVVLACVTSGFGWVLVIAKQVTGELALPLLVQAFPGNTFFGMMVVPHMILSASMLIGIFLLMLEAYQRTCGKRALAAGVLGMALGFAHPYNIVTAYAVIGVFAALVTLRDGLQFRWVVKVAAFYLISLPSVLYWSWVSAGSAEWRQVLDQYRNLGVWTPDPVQLLVLLGLTAIMAGLTFRGFVYLRERSVGELFVSGWFMVNLLIIYLPLNFQINLLNGIQVPMAILATWGIYRHVMPWLSLRAPVYLHRFVRFVPVLFILLVIPTNIYLLSWRILDLSRHTYPDFLYRDDVAALAWIEQRAEPSDVVLSSMVIGHYVPALTGTHAFLAHGVNTLDFFRKRALVEHFFTATTTDADRQAILQAYGIRYVVHGPAERAIGPFDPSTAPYLDAVFTSPHTSVYRTHDATATR